MSKFCQSCSLVYPHILKAQANDYLPTKDDVLALVQYMNCGSLRRCSCLSLLADCLRNVIDGILQLFTEQISLLLNDTNGNDGWDSDSLTQLFQLTSRLFVQTSPIYFSAKQCYSEISREQRIRFERYCFLSESDILIVPLLYEAVCLFCEKEDLRLLVELFNLLTRWCPGRLSHVVTVEVAEQLIFLLCNLRMFLGVELTRTHYPVLCRSIFCYIKQMPDDQLKSQARLNMVDEAFTVIRDGDNFLTTENPLDPLSVPSGPYQLTEIDYHRLDIGHVMFQSPNLTVRLSGIQQINEYIRRATDLSNVASALAREDDLFNLSETELDARLKVSTDLRNWLASVKLVDEIFGPNVHVEIVKQSHFIGSFLATEDAIGQHEIELIWTAARMSHCGKAVHDVLLRMLPLLRISSLRHILTCAGHLPAAEHTELTLILVFQTIQEMWSKATSVLKNRTANRVPSPGLASKRSGSSLSGGHSAKPTAATATTAATTTSSVSAKPICFAGPLRKRARLSLQQLDAADPLAGSVYDKADGQTTAKPELSEADVEAADPAGLDDDTDSGDSSDVYVGDFPEAFSADVRKHLPMLPVALANEIAETEAETMDEPASDTNDDDDDVSSSDSDSDVMDLCNPILDAGSLNALRNMKPAILSQFGQAQRLANLDQLLRTDPLALSLSPNGKTAETAAATVAGRPRRQVVVVPTADDTGEPMLSSNNSPSSVKNMDDFDDEETLAETSDLNVAQSVHGQKTDSSTFLRAELMEQEASPPTTSKPGPERNDPASDSDDQSESVDDSWPEQADNRLAGASSSEEPTSSEPQRSSQDGQYVAEIRDLVNTVAQPGHTLLWDLMKRDSLPHELRHVCIKLLANLLNGSEDPVYRCHFVKACVSNIAHNIDVVASLTLLHQVLTLPAAPISTAILSPGAAGQAGQQQQRAKHAERVRLVQYAVDKLQLVHWFFTNLKMVKNSMSAALGGLSSCFDANGQREVTTTSSSSGQPTQAESSSTAPTTTTSNATGSVLDGQRYYRVVEEVNARLTFIRSLYRKGVTDDSFRLDVAQTDTLWDYVFGAARLATNSIGQISPGGALGQEQRALSLWNEWLQWFMECSMSTTEVHLFSADCLMHIFRYKLSQLPPQKISVTGLNFYEYLADLFRLNRAADGSSELDFLWQVILRADNSLVSQRAVDSLNKRYLLRVSNLSLEQDFVERSMAALKAQLAIIDGSSIEEFPPYERQLAQLSAVLRIVSLVESHVNLYMKFYAFRLKLSQLRDHIKYYSHRMQDMADLNVLVKTSLPSHVQLSQKFSVRSTDYVGTLRARVYHWLEPNIKLSTKFSVLLDVQSTRLGFEHDFKTLEEVGLAPRPSQLNPYEVTAILSDDSAPTNAASATTSPTGAAAAARNAGRLGVEQNQCQLKESLSPAQFPLPMFSDEPHFEGLFAVLDRLAQVRLSSCIQRADASMAVPPTTALENRHEALASSISERLWNLLQLLPTNATLASQMATNGSAVLNTLISQLENVSAERDTHSAICGDVTPLRLLYVLQIIEAELKRTVTLSSHNNVGPSASPLVSQVFSSQPDCWFGRLVRLTKALTETLRDFADNPHLLCYWNAVIQCSTFALRLLLLISTVPRGEKSPASGGGAVTVASGTTAASSSGASSSGASSSPAARSSVSTSSGERSSSAIGTTGPTASGHSVMADLVFRSEAVVFFVRESGSSFSTFIFDVAANFMLNVGRLTNTCSRMHVMIDLNHWMEQVIVVGLQTLFCCIRTAENAYDSTVLFRLAHSPTITSLLEQVFLVSPFLSVRQRFYNSLIAMVSFYPAGTSTAGGLLLHGWLIQLFRLVPLTLDLSLARSLPEYLPAKREHFGPSVCEFYNLLERLIPRLGERLSVLKVENKETAEVENLDLNQCVSQIRGNISLRPVVETRRDDCVDTALTGHMKLAEVILKLNIPLKSNAPESHALIDVIFHCLFDLPNAAEPESPKCKNRLSRDAAFDLVVETCRSSPSNLQHAIELVLSQQIETDREPYPFSYWPLDESRADCGYVGLINLGATCYMNTCLQHLFMLREIRNAVLTHWTSVDEVDDGDIPNAHAEIFTQLQRTFAYLQDSERKAFSPYDLCKVYHMHQAALNTGEQKDMTEFFTDMIGKLEEMGLPLRRAVKEMFGGVLSSSVVSLDCGHVSETLEDFYHVRCQVANMKDLQESLGEFTVKDMLEGDNKYTCSQCQKKVRAEKRASFKRLPRILAINTQRYQFNLTTMILDKVNTHFVFPLRLDMTPYMQQTLMEADSGRWTGTTVCDGATTSSDCFEYQLIGVTVHMGTADGGHYYSFIRERDPGPNHGKWFAFNDAEVRQWDPVNIPAECYGGHYQVCNGTSNGSQLLPQRQLAEFALGEVEKANSAYMLFYERCDSLVMNTEQATAAAAHPPRLSNDLLEVIWDDNRRLIRDRLIFNRIYFSFLWQLFAYLPTTMPKEKLADSHSSATLAFAFLLDTLIHSKERPNMQEWVEGLTKKLNMHPAACWWILDHMGQPGEQRWIEDGVIRCPSQQLRHTIQLLLLETVRQCVKTSAGELANYEPPQPRAVHSTDETATAVAILDEHSAEYRNQSALLRFLMKLLSYLDGDALLLRQHTRRLSEYFGLLTEMSKTPVIGGFFIKCSAIARLRRFYMLLVHDFDLVSSSVVSNGDGGPAATGDVSSASTAEFIEIVDAGSLRSEQTSRAVRPLVIGTSGSRSKLPQACLAKVVNLLCTLMTQTMDEGGNMNLPADDAVALLGTRGQQAAKLVVQMLSMELNRVAVLNFTRLVCRNDTGRAKRVLREIFADMHSLAGDEVYLPHTVLLTQLVLGSPSDDGQPDYVQLILTDLWSHCQRSPLVLFTWLTEADVFSIDRFRQFVRNNAHNIARHCLAGGTDDVRRSAASLLVRFLPDLNEWEFWLRMMDRSSYNCQANTLCCQCSTILLQPCQAVLSDDAADVMQHVLLSLVEHFGEVQLLVNNDNKNRTTSERINNRLCYYFILLKLFSATDTLRLLLQAIIGQMVEYQETLFRMMHYQSWSKQTWIVLLWHTCCGLLENVHVFLQSESSDGTPLWMALGETMISVTRETRPGANELSHMNHISLPALYSLMLVLSQRSTEFAIGMASVDAFRWALRYVLTVNSICIKDVQKQIIDLCVYTFAQLKDASALKPAQRQQLERFVADAMETFGDMICEQPAANGYAQFYVMSTKHLLLNHVDDRITLAVMPIVFGTSLLSKLGRALTMWVKSYSEMTANAVNSAAYPSTHGNRQLANLHNSPMFEPARVFETFSNIHWIQVATLKDICELLLRITEWARHHRDERKQIDETKRFSAGREGGFDIVNELLRRLLRMPRYAPPISIPLRTGSLAAATVGPGSTVGGSARLPIATISVPAPPTIPPAELAKTANELIKELLLFHQIPVLMRLVPKLLKEHRAPFDYGSSASSDGLVKPPVSVGGSTTEPTKTLKSPTSTAGRPSASRPGGAAARRGQPAKSASTNGPETTSFLMRVTPALLHLDRDELRTETRKRFTHYLEPYWSLVCMCVRVAVNSRSLQQCHVDLALALARETVLLRSPCVFVLLNDLLNVPSMRSKALALLFRSKYLMDVLKSVLFPRHRHLEKTPLSPRHIYAPYCLDVSCVRPLVNIVLGVLVECTTLSYEVNPSQVAAHFGQFQLIDGPAADEVITICSDDDDESTDHQGEMSSSAHSLPVATASPSSGSSTTSSPTIGNALVAIRRALCRHALDVCQRFVEAFRQMTFTDLLSCLEPLLLLRNLVDVTQLAAVSCTTTDRTDSPDGPYRLNFADALNAVLLRIDEAYFTAADISSPVASTSTGTVDAAIVSSDYERSFVSPTPNTADSSLSTGLCSGGVLATKSQLPTSQLSDSDPTAMDLDTTPPTTASLATATVTATATLTMATTSGSNMPTTSRSPDDLDILSVGSDLDSSQSDSLGDEQGSLSALSHVVRQLMGHLEASAGGGEPAAVS